MGEYSRHSACPTSTRGILVARNGYNRIDSSPGVTSVMRRTSAAKAGNPKPKMMVNVQASQSGSGSSPPGRPTDLLDELPPDDGRDDRDGDVEEPLPETLSLTEERYRRRAGVTAAQTPRTAVAVYAALRPRLPLSDPVYRKHS